MGLYIDREFADRVGPYVRNFKRKGKDVWNFSCPICNDSKKDSRKARGYIYHISNKLNYACHNCGTSTTLGSLLKTLDTNLFQEYSLKRLKDDAVLTFDNHSTRDEPKRRPSNNSVDAIKRISDLPLQSSVREYVRNRRIPSRWDSYLGYTEQLLSLVDSACGRGVYKVQNGQPKLILPFLDENKNLFAFQARALDNSQPRYLTFKVTDQPKIFGLDRVDWSKEVICVEGPIDSLFIENCLAAAGSDLDSLINRDIIYCLDNEPRNVEIVKKIKKLIDMGKRVVIWPDLPYKDINDWVLADLDPEQIIRSNTYSGIEATLKFNAWRKV